MFFSLKEGTKKSRNFTKRSFSGCLNCKKKKKKCDERKPNCTRCERGKDNCSWPGFCSVVPSFVGKNSKIIKKVPNKESAHKLGLVNSNKVTVPQQGLMKKVFGPNIYRPFFMWPDILMNEGDANCFFYFLNKFLPSLSHPFAHDIALEGICITTASQSKVLRSIFIACGATMIAFENEEFKDTSYHKYINSLQVLIREIKSGRMRGSEDWLFMAVQVLQTHCFRESVVGLPAATVVPHIVAAYQIIKKRFTPIINHPSEYSNSTTKSQDNNLKNSGIMVNYSPLDQALLENFLFNYPIAIFFGKSEMLEKNVPNPFELFNQAEFQGAFHNFEKENKINFLSRYAFEVSSKCAWMCRLRLPLQDGDISLCNDLLQSSYVVIEKFSTVDICILSKSARQSVSIAKIVLIISTILLRKMQDLKTLHAIDFSGEVNSIVDEISKPHNDTLILPGWTLLVASCASVKKWQSDFFRSQFDKLSSNLNSNMLLQIISFVDFACSDLESGNSFELIFDTKVVDMICS